ncbi:MAG: DinB family protein [Planctomycetota bacterium]
MSTARMDEVGFYRRLYLQEVWANDQQIEAVAGLAKHALGPELRKAIDKLAHLVLARELWLNRICPEKTVNIPELFPDDWDLSLLRESHASSQRRWGDYLDSIRDEDLEKVVVYSSISGETFENQLRDILIHVWSHGFYHRGQIGMLINQLGGTPPAIDFIVHARVSRGE